MSLALEKDGWIDERYRLVGPLGQGGMGMVWTAHQAALGRDVAIKFIANSVAADNETFRRFRREAQLAAALKSPHIAQVYDVGRHDGHPYIVMELLEGESLAARLARRKRLAPEEVVELVDGVCKGLEEAHEKNIVHRDLKPDNIFWAKVASQEIVKVLDFGIAKEIELGARAENDGTTKEGTIIGTPLYMSPEQSQAVALDHRSDLWSLAIVAYECLTGINPFDAPTQWETLAAICSRPVPPPSDTLDTEPALDVFFQHALARQPARRFGSAIEFMQAFADAVVGTATAPAPLAVTTPGSITPKLRPVSTPPIADTVSATTKPLTRSVETASGPPIAAFPSGRLAGAAVVLAILGLAWFVSGDPGQPHTATASLASAITVAAPEPAAPSASPMRANPTASSASAAAARTVIPPPLGARRPRVRPHVNPPPPVNTGAPHQAQPKPPPSNPFGI